MEAEKIIHTTEHKNKTICVQEASSTENLMSVSGFPLKESESPPYKIWRMAPGGENEELLISIVEVDPLWQAIENSNVVQDNAVDFARILQMDDIPETDTENSHFTQEVNNSFWMEIYKETLGLKYKLFTTALEKSGILFEEIEITPENSDKTYVAVVAMTDKYCETLGIEKTSEEASSILADNAQKFKSLCESKVLIASYSNKEDERRYCLADEFEENNPQILSDIKRDIDQLSAKSEKSR